MRHRGLYDAEVGDAGARADRGEFDPQGASELFDCGFAHHVRRAAHTRSECRARGDDDDVSVGRDHVVECRAQRVEHSGEVDAHDAVEIMSVHGAQCRRLGRHAGVGDDDVEAAEVFDDSRGDLLHELAVADIGPEPQCRGPELPGGGLRAALVDIDDGNPRTAAVQQLREFPADALTRAGDQHGLAADVVGRPRYPAERVELADIHYAVTSYASTSNLLVRLRYSKLQLG